MAREFIHRLMAEEQMSNFKTSRSVIENHPLTKIEWEKKAYLWIQSRAALFQFPFGLLSLCFDLGLACRTESTCRWREEKASAMERGGIVQVTGRCFICRLSCFLFLSSSSSPPYALRLDTSATLLSYVDVSPPSSVEYPSVTCFATLHLHFASTVFLTRASCCHDSTRSVYPVFVLSDAGMELSL
ncbi:uncharacterized protein BDV17DRAFT_181849 [Aspergillus undulatus]|uniref:uncharacterized protein n=1 Tax=Aspergillus undulatus TaxID=1810928 RepID=UPI003CCDAB42